MLRQGFVSTVRGGGLFRSTCISAPDPPPKKKQATVPSIGLIVSGLLQCCFYLDSLCSLCFQFVVFGVAGVWCCVDRGLILLGCCPYWPLLPFFGAGYGINET